MGDLRGIWPLGRLLRGFEEAAAFVACCRPIHDFRPASALFDAVSELLDFLLAT
jgi:hypothetical protein